MSSPRLPRFAIAAALLSAVGAGSLVDGPLIGAARAQFDAPAPKALTGEQVFARQCGTCHTVNSAEPPRQGPTLDHVYGRKAGSVKGYDYSAGFAKADWVWDDKTLDAWLTNPQAVIPGANMPYRQAKPEVRAAVIDYLKGQSK